MPQRFGQILAPQRASWVPRPTVGQALPWLARTMPVAISLALTLALAPATAWGQPGGRTYPSARHGGNYMHNYYLPPAPSSTPWAPSWSPDGRWIAVAMSGSIWKVDPETGRADEVSYNDKYHSMPDWSPDGRWIVYTADDGGETIQLEVVDVETGTARALTDDEFIYTDPVYSPDGTQLAYVSTKPSGYFNVYVRAIRDGQWAGDEIHRGAVLVAFFAANGEPVMPSGRAESFLLVGILFTSSSS